jgi:hypothetical protein
VLLAAAPAFAQQAMPSGAGSGPRGYVERAGATPIVHEGEVGLYEAFLTVPLQFQRTGRLGEDLVGSNRALAPHLVVASAGSPVFLVNFSETTRTMGGSLVSERVREMWCGVRDEPSPAIEDKRGFCVEVGRAAGAFVMGTAPTMIYSGDAPKAGAFSPSPYFPQSLQVVGRRHTPVTIIEEAVEFPIAQEFLITAWSSSHASLMIVGSDGRDRSVFSQVEIPVDASGFATFSKGPARVQLAQIAEGRFSVRIAQPPTTEPTP